MPRRKQAARSGPVEVFDVSSGMGGTFTVSVVETRASGVTVRVWYGRATESGWESWKEWDGYRFGTTIEKLSKRRMMPLYK